eukprot:COSAG02_NODE_51253_length_315_cov_0.782407_1_plen_84_part_00
MLVPYALDAVTVKRYQTPFCRPTIDAVTEVDAVVVVHLTSQCEDPIVVQAHLGCSSQEEAVVNALHVAASPTSPQLESIAGVV